MPAENTEPEFCFDAAVIARLIPHAGRMQLLAGVVSISPDSIECAATSHTDPGNPLRSAGRLHAIVAAEYAAQAAAAHSALAGREDPSAIQNTQAQKQGVLAVLSNVVWRAPQLDDIAGRLHIRATRLAKLGAGFQYRFEVGELNSLPDHARVTGELIVAFRSNDTPPRSSHKTPD